jgi:hypothetical protein
MLQYWKRSEDIQRETFSIKQCLIRMKIPNLQLSGGETK